jgi:hypothetical protein
MNCSLQLQIALFFAVYFYKSLFAFYIRPMNRTAKDSSLQLLLALSFAVDFNQRIYE